MIDTATKTTGYGARNAATPLAPLDVERREPGLHGLVAVVSTDERAMAAYEPYVKLLKRNGRITLVGVLAPLEIPVDKSVMAFERLSFGGSLLGSIAETREILDFCAAHGIAPEVEPIPLDRINEAFENVVAGKVRYRYVIEDARR